MCTASSKQLNLQPPWYSVGATTSRALLTDLTHRYAERIQAQVAHIGFGEYRSQWGSCNRDGVIRFDWQLIRAPLAVVQYVAAHEVCHLRHMNHSKRFWSLVATLCPDYNTQRRWLREHGYLLKHR